MHYFALEETLLLEGVEGIGEGETTVGTDGGGTCAPAGVEAGKREGGAGALAGAVSVGGSTGTTSEERTATTGGALGGLGRETVDACAAGLGAEEAGEAWVDQAWLQAADSVIWTEIELPQRRYH